MQTIQSIIERRAITMRALPTNSNPNMDTDGRVMDHWACRLRNDAGAEMRVTFSMGTGLGGRAPKVEDVLDCLASDAAGIANAQGFCDWCSEYGYDADSRKAKKTYDACCRGRDRLQAFMGADYKGLLFETERL